MNHSNYATLIRNNLQAAFEIGAHELALRLDGRSAAGAVIITAFGAECRLRPDGVRRAAENEEGPRGVIISLLARHACSEAGIEEPWQAFRELPDSMPYVGAFRSHTEQPLVAHVEDIMTRAASIADGMEGRVIDTPISGDCGLVLEPLPKIRLCYLFYRPDDEFPASVTCLFSANAQRFLPTDALADVGEYTSRKIIDLGA
ncbi:MAG: DUF3786 domain-containing protein [Desulfobacterales bacterium]